METAVRVRAVNDSGAGVWSDEATGRAGFVRGEPIDTWGTLAVTVASQWTADTRPPAAGVGWGTLEVDVNAPIEAF